MHKRFCTRLAKIFPLRDYLAGEQATVYYGIRADETRIGFDNSNSPNIIPAYPLQKLGLGLQQVYSLLEKENLLPPAFYWSNLYDLVITILGKDIDLLDKLTAIQKRVLFAGRSRANCYFCFNQAIYEWVWLLDVHPNLYERAIQLEQDYGASNDTREKGFYFNAHGEWYSLPNIKNRAEQIREKHARKIARYIYKIGGDIPIVERRSLFNVSSCGLLCGK